MRRGTLESCVAAFGSCSPAITMMFVGFVLMTACYGLLLRVFFGISHPCPKTLSTFMDFHRNHTNITCRSELALSLTAPTGGKHDLSFKVKVLCGVTHITGVNSQKVQAATESLRVIRSTPDTRPGMGMEGRYLG